MRRNYLFMNDAERLYKIYSGKFMPTSLQSRYIAYITLLYDLEQFRGGGGLSTRWKPKWPFVVSTSLPIESNICKAKVLLKDYIPHISTNFATSVYKLSIHQQFGRVTRSKLLENCMVHCHALPTLCFETVEGAVLRA